MPCAPSPIKRTILFGLLCGSVLLANPVFANDTVQLLCEAQAVAKQAQLPLLSVNLPAEFARLRAFLVG